MKPLVIAAHGTRIAEGQVAARELVDRVRGLLPGVAVYESFVELDTPTIPDAVAAALAGASEREAVVMPLMLGAGGHVADDIPEGIAEGRARVPGEVTYAAHLGPHPLLREAVRERIAAVLGDWEPAETAVVFLGRGCSVPRANSDHVHLGRMLFEEGGYEHVVPAFIQVTRPSLTDGLDTAYALGSRRIVLAPNFLFPGRLQRWADQAVERWGAEHPDAEVRLADVIGPCDALAQVVVDRYREAAGLPRRGVGSPVYLAGLDLRGRDVLVAGAGRIATRRLPALLDAGARVRVVAPEATDAIAEAAASGRVAWEEREVRAEDVDGAWYVIAATSSPEANALVAERCAQQRVFCVRVDDATLATARTPATGSVAGLTVGVIGDRTPHRSMAARDAAVSAVARALE